MQVMYSRWNRGECFYVCGTTPELPEAGREWGEFCNRGVGAMKLTKTRGEKGELCKMGGLYGQRKKGVRKGWKFFDGHILQLKE
jgi:hypothetical protein